jgi:C4-dicarboxylate-specific signal transduction histidine kinase
MNELVRDAALVLRGDAMARDVPLRLELDEGPSLIRGDRVQIQQVLVNLLLNAIEASAGVPTEERQVLVRTRVAEDTVQVSVEDRGPGLPVGFETRIFEPFYSTKPHGLGMGLSISSTIVQAHGGCLRGTNHPSGGAVFSFGLPRAGEGDDSPDQSELPRSH